MKRGSLPSLLPLLLLTLACAPREPSASPPTGEIETETTESGSTETTGSSDAQALECEGYVESDYPEEPVSFSVTGSRAIMAGYVDSSTPARLAALLADHPEVELIVMPFVPGSDDDEANLEAARMLHASGLSTCVPSTGLIASGGVDFFLAGARRAAGPGAPIGVHSWADGSGVEGSELPMDHPDHALFLDYYADIGIDAAFYWFTLQAAPAESIHWMSAEELELYGVLTELR